MSQFGPSINEQVNGKQVYQNGIFRACCHADGYYIEAITGGEWKTFNQRHNSIESAINEVNEFNKNYCESIVREQLNAKNTPSHNFRDETKMSNAIREMVNAGNGLEIGIAIAIKHKPKIYGEFQKYIDLWETALESARDANR